MQRTTAARSLIHASGLPALPHPRTVSSASAHRRARVGTPDRTTIARVLRGDYTLARVIRSSALSSAIAALVPASLAAGFAVVPPMSLVVAGLALPLGLATRPRDRSAWIPWLVGVVLAATAALSAASARQLHDVAGAREWPTIDLATTSVPTTPPEFVAITGVPRTGIVLDEYAVEHGGLPDQSQAAAAVLVPIAPSADPTVAMRGLVVARVRPDELAAFVDGETVTLRGHAEPLSKELLATIVDLAGAGDRPDHGLLVDTLRVPTPREAWTRTAIAIVLALLAFVAYAFATRAQPATQRPNEHR